MDSFELNKIIGAILGTLLFVMGVGFLAEAIYAPIEDRGPGYELPEPEGTPGSEPAVEVAAVPIANLLASADVAAGEASASKCTGCHNFAEGAGNKAGPELYGVVGRTIGAHEGFSYSVDLADMGAAGATWTYDDLNAFILAPHDYAPGTKMNFGGVKPDPERANIIAYLSTLSASPVPFPPPEAVPAEGEAAAAPAEGEATAEGAAGPVEGDAPLTDADAIPTPTETQSETQVQGSPTTSAPASATPVEAAPADEPAPAAEPAAPPAGEVVPEIPAQ